MLKLQPLGVENLQWVVKLSELNIAQQMGDGRFLASDGTGGLFTELLLLGFNNGPQALGERMLSILSGSDAGETQSQVTPQDKIYQCKFSVNTESLQCPSDATRCPIILETPEEGV
ncbi:T3SS effector NleG family protein, partial [Escherichia coli]